MKRLPRRLLQLCFGVSLATTLVGALLLWGPLLARQTMSPYPNIAALPQSKAGVTRISAHDALIALEALDINGVGAGHMEDLTRANALVAAGMAHYWPLPGAVDPAIECGVLEDPGLWWKIQLGEWTGSDPDTLLRRKRAERGDWRTALALGVGFCSQQAFILDGFLSERGIEARAVGIGGHVIVVASSTDGECVLDPDYGVVLPFSLATAETDRARVAAQYLAAGYPPKQVELVSGLFDAAGNEDCRPPSIGLGSASERQAWRVIFVVSLMLTLAAAWGIRATSSRQTQA